MLADRQPARPNEETALLNSTFDQAPAGASVDDLIGSLERVVDQYERRQRSVAVRIHEQIGQQLFGAQLYVQAAERQSGDCESARRTLRMVKESLETAIAETRRLISQLRLPDLDGFGLVGGIKFLLCEAKNYSGRRITFIHSDGLDNLPPRTRLAAFRIVDELLTGEDNCPSEEVDVELLQADAHLRIEVRRDGAGGPAIGGILGSYQAVRDWATIVGGRAAFETGPKGDARVIVELPSDAGEAR